MTSHGRFRAQAPRWSAAAARHRGHRGPVGPRGRRRCSRRPGHVTLDPGFVNTASCASAITFIDGDAGILRYRGYPIDQLAEKSSFLEVSYLLIYGELPTPTELEEFTDRIRRHTLLHEDLRRFFDGFPRDAHPMAVLSSAVSALSTFYQDSLDPFDREHVEISTVRLMAKLPTIASYAYKKSIGQPLLYPDNSLGYVENFLRMTFGVPADAVRGRPDHGPGARHAVRPARRPRAELLHVDRAAGRLEQRQPVRLGLGRRQRAVRPAARRRQPGGAGDARRASTTTAATSTGFVRRVKDKEPGVKLMGFGHRVYKNYDPRAAIVKKADQRGARGGSARRTRCSTSRCGSRRSRSPTTTSSRASSTRTSTSTPGVIYKAMGFPTRMFTVLFALGRLPGWIAQWREMIEDPATKIGRPRQVYVGSPERAYVVAALRPALSRHPAQRGEPAGTPPALHPVGFTRHRDEPMTHRE